MRKMKSKGEGRQKTVEIEAADSSLVTRHSSLHIAIDAHSVGTGLAGNESYITNLIEALAELDAVNRYTLYVTKREAVERFENRWPHVTVSRTWPHTPLVRIPLTLAAELRRRPVDLLHVQYTAPPLAPCPVVATIHDLSFEHLPETFKRRSRAQLRLTVRRTARSAARVLVPSEHTRRDICETYNLAPERVAVTPLAAPAHFAPVGDESEIRRVRELYRIEGDYVLTVGSIQPRKNLVRLVRAYAGLRRARPQANLPKLVLVGKRAWLYGETLRAIEESGIGDLTVLTGYVSEKDLPALYTGALCFVYPSYFEGFGLPPLEAMACGCITIGYHGFGGREFFTDDLAFPISVGDVLTFVRTTEQVLKRWQNDPASLMEMTRRAASFVAERYSPANEVQDIIRTWQQILPGGS
jgi:glycosyltransferase involved in cell wall biosynthesis